MTSVVPVGESLWTNRSSTTSLSRNPIVISVCGDRRHGGPYTIMGQVLVRLVPGVMAARPDIVAAHDIEILTAAPDLGGVVPATRLTLTALAVPEEHTRFYSPQRLTRLAHGFADFLRACHRAGLLEQLVLDLRSVDAADRTDLVALHVLAARLPSDLLVLRLHCAGDALPAPLAGSSELRPAPELTAATSAEAPPVLDQDRVEAARRFVRHECHDTDEDARIAYEGLSSSEREQLHRERLAELETTGGAAGRHGARPFHAERAGDLDLAVAALLETEKHCLEMGFYEGAVDAALRLRRLITWDTHSRLMGKVIGPLTQSLMMLGVVEPVRDLFAEVLEHSTDPALHSLAYYGSAMVNTRYSPPERIDHVAARRWLNSALAISRLWPDKEFRSFVTAFNTNGMALVELHQGHLEAALRLVDEGLALLAEDVPVGRQELHRTVLHHNRAQVLAALGRRDEALVEYDTVIAADPWHSEYHLDRGNLLRAMGRPEEAVAAYQQAIVSSPPYVEPVLNLANTLLELGQPELAAAGYDRVLELEPDRADALLNRGAVALQLGDLDSARTASETLAKLGPTADAECLTGQVALLGGEHDLAVAAFNRALALAPHLVAAHAGLAAALLKAGRAGRAVAALSAALERCDDPVLWFNRGVALRSLHSEAEAARDFARAATLWETTDPGQAAEALAERDACLATPDAGATHLVGLAR